MLLSIIGDVAGDNAVSEFIDKVMQNIFRIFYAGLYESTEKVLKDCSIHLIRK